MAAVPAFAGEMSVLKGMRILITGAGSGIGRGISELLVGRGASVFMVDINAEAVEKAAAGLESAFAWMCDVSDEAQMQETFRLAIECLGGLDAVVNNAGVLHLGSILETAESDFDRVIAVNMKGVFLGLKYGAPAIARSGGGAVVNIASVSPSRSFPGASIYHAATAGVISLTQTASVEFRHLSVRVNAICPGIIQTPMADTARRYLGREANSQFMPIVEEAQGRIGAPRDIAGTTAFLLSDDASLVSGVALAVDGGLTARLL
jgi:NAD(P)-dependent dehydrogenase (short-subunit alcohol dehydrogenase family)